MDLTIPETVKTTVGQIDLWLGGVSVKQIETQEECQSVADLTKQVKLKLKELEETRTSITGPINKALDGINDLFKKPKEKLLAFEKGLKGLLDGWFAEQERKRLEAQRIADEQARKEREKVAAEEKRLRDIEEAKRREADQKFQEAREADARAAAAKTEQDRNAAEADALKLRGQASKAEAKADATAEQAEFKNAISHTIVAPTIKAAGKTAGISYVKEWAIEIKDATAFILWATERKPDGTFLDENRLAFIEISEKKLKAMAKAVKGQMTWPGIKVSESNGIRINTKGAA